MSSANQPISTADEVKVVALLARGDTQKSIAEEVGISPASVGVIKGRNADILSEIHGALVLQNTKQAKKILDRSHTLIDKRLSAEEQNYDDRVELKDKLDNSEITYSQYLSGLRAIPTISLAELTGLSKEMFNQSQIEDGKPTSIPGGAGANSDDAAKKLQDLIEALHSNDSVKMLELINA